jgi:hypothetical protein
LAFFFGDIVFVPTPGFYLLSVFCQGYLKKRESDPPLQN